MSTLVKPTVHVNGTDADTLTDAYLAADAALYDALAKLCQTEPHARDYVDPQDPGGFHVAKGEHTARIAKLESVRMDLAELVRHVDETRVRR